MKNILILLTATIFLILLSSCKKEDTTPTYHKDIFRCKVNGVEWVATCPSDGLFGCESIKCWYYSDTPSIELVGLYINSDKTINQSIHIYTFKDLLLNTQLPSGLPGIFKDFNKNPGCRFWDWDPTNKGFIEVLIIDTINHTITGIFEFESINQCNDTIRVTEGYFDVKYYY